MWKIRRRGLSPRLQSLCRAIAPLVACSAAISKVYCGVTLLLRTSPTYLGDARMPIPGICQLGSLMHGLFETCLCHRAMLER